MKFQTLHLKESTLLTNFLEDITKSVKIFKKEKSRPEEI
jgi:hypothetical protein